MDKFLGSSSPPPFRSDLAISTDAYRLFQLGQIQGSVDFLRGNTSSGVKSSAGQNTYRVQTCQRLVSAIVSP